MACHTMHPSVEHIPTQSFTWLPLRGGGASGSLLGLSCTPPGLILHIAKFQSKQSHQVKPTILLREKLLVCTMWRVLCNPSNLHLIQSICDENTILLLSPPCHHIGTKSRAIQEAFDQHHQLGMPVQPGLKPVTFSVPPNYYGSPNQMLSASLSSLFSEWEQTWNPPANWMRNSSHVCMSELAMRSWSWCWVDFQFQPPREDIWPTQKMLRGLFNGFR